VRVLFERFDTDSSGSIDEQELAVGLRDVLGFEATQQQLDQLMREVDGDGDNQIDMEELTKVTAWKCRRRTLLFPLADELCTLHPALYTLHHAPCTLHSTPCTLHPAPSNWQVCFSIMNKAEAEFAAAAEAAALQAAIQARKRTVQTRSLSLPPSLHIHTQPHAPGHGCQETVMRGAPWGSRRARRCLPFPIASLTVTHRNR